ncbi:hypothetical protein CEW89_12035 [Celeribacter ethanolicus]|uniref:DUF4177 domain-containing protein n=1 Tax=Celeribacter ethanolicus TaxID=1758178 RepID=A0A291GDK6_9RHOB|nr:hypothetical protein [Celeribacter ethanolicus]ATG48228.1 hypothetical protein CEW89_12035 [Celeribacter ethanolicus]
MKKHLLPLLVALVVLPGLANASCYASYKAKRDNPLKLHFGVAEVSASQCTKQAAAKALAPRLEKEGWHLLSIVAMIPEEKLGEVKADAGDYFLRY